MSTRIRIVLKAGDATISRGNKAIAESLMLAHNTSGRFIKGLLNRFYAGNNKLEKLKELAAKLPNEYALHLFREAKGTRRNKSLYWAQVRGRIRPNGALE